MRYLATTIIIALALSLNLGFVSSAIAQLPVGNPNFGTHQNWDRDGGIWKPGNSGGWIEGRTVPHVFTINANGLMQDSVYFVDICLAHLLSGSYGYNGVMPYDTTVDPGVQEDETTPIVIHSTFGPVDAENLTLLSFADSSLTGNGGDCTEANGEWGWRVTFSVMDSTQASRVYFGGLLAKVGDTALEGGAIDGTNSPSTRNGVWQSRAESGGDRTTQISSVGAFLPVELVSFTATLDSRTAILNWETASETNNAGFSVEHALAGEEFVEIGYVDGNGTTAEPQTYSFRTGDLDAGTHRFRLKQLDFDGAFEYSPIVELSSELPGTHVLSNAYPNPFNPSTNFTLAVSAKQHVDVALYDALGRQVQSIYSGVMEANSSRVLSIRADDLPSGTYVYVATGRNFSDSRSVVLMK